MMAAGSPRVSTSGAPGVAAGMRGASRLLERYLEALCHRTRLNRQADFPRGSGRGRRSIGTGGDIDAEHEPGHVVHVVLAVRARPVRHRAPVPGVVGAPGRVRGNVEVDMAVHEPLSRALRRPCHGHCRAFIHSLGHHLPLLVRSVDRIGDARASAVHAIVEAVQVHRVIVVRRVDPAPVDGVTHREVDDARCRARTAR